MFAIILNEIYRQFLHAAAGNGEPRGKAMTEVVTALCVFFSISIFLAHAVDAFRAR